MKTYNKINLKEYILEIILFLLFLFYNIDLEISGIIFNLNIHNLSHLFSILILSFILFKKLFDGKIEIIDFLSFIAVISVYNVYLTIFLIFYNLFENDKMISTPKFYYILFIFNFIQLYQDSVILFFFYIFSKIKTNNKNYYIVLNIIFVLIFFYFNIKIFIILFVLYIFSYNIWKNFK